MKSILLLSVFLMSIAPAYAQWSFLHGFTTTQPVGDQFLSGVEMDISPDNSIYVGTYYHGTSPHNYWYSLKKSQDNGQSWTICHEPNMNSQFCSLIHCIAPSELVLSTWGEQMGIFSSADDCQSWTLLGSTGADGRFISGQFIDPLNGLALHAYAYDYNKKSTAWDGRSQFCRIIDGNITYNYIDTLYFGRASLQLIDSSTAIILCKDNLATMYQSGNNKILKTSDFGLSWTTVYHDTIYGLNHIHFDSPYEGIAVGNKGKIMHTIDGGLTWNLMESGTQKNIHSVDSRNGIFYCVGDTGLILRYDTGMNSWNDVSFGNLNYSKIRINSSFLGYIQCTDFNILRSDIALALPDSEIEPSINISPNPCNNLLSYSIPNQGVLKEIRVYNLTGQQVIVVNNNFNGQLDLSGMAPGCYFLLFDFGKRIELKKLIRL